MDVLSAALGLFPLVAALVVLFEGARRLRGKRARAAVLLGAVARAQEAGVFPPSLRADQSPRVAVVEEVARADNSIRATPAAITQRPVRSLDRQPRRPTLAR